MACSSTSSSDDDRGEHLDCASAVPTQHSVCNAWKLRDIDLLWWHSSDTWWRDCVCLVQFINLQRVPNILRWRHHQHSSSSY
jgi:hypothetical protein